MWKYYIYLILFVFIKHKGSTQIFQIQQHQQKKPQKIGLLSFWSKERIKTFYQTDFIRLLLGSGFWEEPNTLSLCFVSAVGNLKSLVTHLFVKSAENRHCLILPWASLWLCLLCAQSAQIRPSTCLISWLLLVPPAPFRKPSLNILREAKAAQAPRAHFDPCRSEAFIFSILRLSESWRPWQPDVGRPGSLPVPHAVAAYGDGFCYLGLEVDLRCFWRPVGKEN